MRVPRSFTRGPQHMSVNLTPMVDVIFMLTIFFMLVTRFSSAEQVPMELPNPDQSRAKIFNLPQRVVLNCRPASAGEDAPGAVYSIGPNKPEPLTVISERLAVMKRQAPDLNVIIRADRRLRYDLVQQAMRVVARHDIDMLNVVAHMGGEE